MPGADTKSTVHLDDIRYVNTGIQLPLEIRSLMREQHVFPAGSPIALTLSVHAAEAQSVTFEIFANRSDNKVNRKFVRVVSLRKGEQSFTLDLPKLPRGYYSVGVIGKGPRNSFRQGAHMQVVPDRDVEDWLGDSEFGAYIYDRYELRDLYLGGYRFLRRGVTGDAAVTARLNMGFQILSLTQDMLSDRTSIDLEHYRKMRDAYELSLKDTDIRGYFKLKDYAGWEATVAGRSRKWKGKIDYWEFGNEPDRAIYKGAEKGKFSMWGTGADYAEALSHFHRAVKQGNPQARVVVGGITCSISLPGRRQFVPDLLDAGGAESFDVFAIHGYAGTDNAEKVLDELRKRGIERPFVDTERGYRSLDRHSLRETVHDLFWHKQKGALFFISFINRPMNWGNPGSMKHGTAWPAHCTRFWNGSPNRQWSAFSTGAFMLDRTTRVEKLDAGLYDGYSFQSAEGHGVVAYVDSGTYSELFRSRGVLRKYDVLGNEEILGHTAPVELSYLPTYVVSTMPIERGADAARGVAARNVALVQVDGRLCLQVEVDGLPDGKPVEGTVAGVPAGWRLERASARALSPHAGTARFTFPVASLTSVDRGRIALRLQTDVGVALRAVPISVARTADRDFVLRLDSEQHVVQGRAEWTGTIDRNSYYGKALRADNLSGSVALSESGGEAVISIEVKDDEVIFGKRPGGMDSGDRVILEVAGKEAELFPMAAGTVIVESPDPACASIQAVSARTAAGYRVSIVLPSSLTAERQGAPLPIEVRLCDTDRHVGQTDRPYLIMSTGRAFLLTGGK